MFRDMDKMLSSILTKAFIIPLSEREIDTIEKVVDVYLNDVDVAKLQLCGDVYFNRDRNDVFQSKLEENADSLEIKLPEMSDLAYVALAEFILCAMAGSSTMSDTFRFLTSMFVRNFLVLQKTERQLFYPEALISTLKYADTYMEEKSKAKELEEHLFKPKIFNANGWHDIIGEEESLSKNHFEEIKTYALKAEKYDFLQAVTSAKKMKCKDSFQKAFEVAYRLSHISSWSMVDANPKATIMQIMSGCKARKKMQDINVDTDQFPCEKMESSSSVLLNYIYHSDEHDEELGLMVFSPTELAVYLYYEFLFEKLLMEYGK